MTGTIGIGVSANVRHVPKKCQVVSVEVSEIAPKMHCEMTFEHDHLAFTAQNMKMLTFRRKAINNDI